jgi:hypothetical protein
MFGVSAQTAAIAAGVVLLAPVVMYGAWKLAAAISDDPETTDEPFPPTDADGTETEVVELEPPRMQGSRFGLIGQLYKVRQYLRKREKLAARGYVQWYLVDDAFPTPRFVKPRDKGGGCREVEHENAIYLFPDGGGMPAAEQGMWTYIHSRGEPRPVNVREPEWPGMSAEAVKEYATMRVTASAPSFFDKLDIDGEDAVKYALAIGIGVTLVTGAFGGM